MASPQVADINSATSRSHAAMATVMARILSGTGREEETNLRERRGEMEEPDKMESGTQIKKRKLQRYPVKSHSRSPFQHEDMSDDERESLLGAGGGESDHMTERRSGVIHHSSGPADLVKQCHQLPMESHSEEEKLLQRMATRGVVQLFNAVSKQQKIIEKKTKEAGNSERKRSKVLNSINKGSFIDMLKSGDNDSTQKTGKTKMMQHKTLPAQETEPGWNILKDGYMKTPSAMMDWQDEEGLDSCEAGDTSDSDGDDR